MTASLGFIGIGKMGAPMAARIMFGGSEKQDPPYAPPSGGSEEQDPPYVVFDTDGETVARLTARGARAASSVLDLASKVDVVFLCLPTPDVVNAVTLGPEGIAAGSRTRVVVDLGTTGPVMARSVASRLRERGITYVDSPVTGGIAGAVNGTLTVMASCPRPVFDEVEPLLARLGRVVYTGEAAGLAQTAKLANNLLSAAALAVSSEAMAMGVKAGIDPATLLAIINAGSGRNSATEDKFPRAILTRSFDFGITTGLFLKDVRLCVEEAESLGVPMVVGSAVRELFLVSKARYGADADFTSIAKVLEEWARIRFAIGDY